MKSNLWVCLAEPNFCKNAAAKDTSPLTPLSNFCICAVSFQNKTEQNKKNELVIGIIFQKLVQGEHELGRQINDNLPKDDDKGRLIPL